MLTTEAKYKQ